MERNYIEDKTFEKIDFADASLPKGVYENCIFNRCNFADADLSNFEFLECEFNGCNLSMVKLEKTGFKDLKFKDCKLLGMQFSSCSDFLFAVSFTDCVLNHSSFYKRKMKKTIYNNSSLQEVDFTEADLNNATFNNCDLTGATFENTNLEKADFRTSVNYSINPQLNKLKKAKFSMPAVVGLLDQYDIVIE